MHKKTPHVLKSWRSTDSFILGALLILALLLRLPLLNGSFWLDEAAQALESSRPLVEQFDIAKDFQPPLFHLIVHAFAQLSTTEWWLRLASLLPGLVTIIFSYKLARLSFTEKQSQLVALLLATSQYHIYFSQELRPYSLAAMWGIISTYYFFAHKQKLSLPYILTSIAGIYSVYTFPFLLIGHGTAAIISKTTSFTQWLKHQAAIILAFLPWLPWFYQQLTTGITLKESLPGWAEVVSLPAIKSIPLTFAKFSMGIIDIQPNLLTAVLIVTTVLPIGMLTLRTLLKKQQTAVLSIILAAIVSAWFISLAIPVLEPKRFLFLLPLLYIVAIAGASGLKYAKQLITFILIGNLIALTAYWLNPDYQREPWRKAIADLESVARPSDVVIFAFYEPFAPYVWYKQNQLPTITPPFIPVTSQNFNLDITGQRQIFVFEYLMDLTDPNRVIFARLERLGYQVTGYEQYPGIGRIFRYQPSEIFARFQAR